MVNGDTSPEMLQRVRSMMMARSGIERVQMMSQMYDFARSLVLATAPKDASPAEIRRHLCTRMYGTEVNVDAFVRAYQARFPDKH